MTKTQVENCVAIDAMTEQTQENNLKHYLHLSLELACFLTLLNVTAHVTSMIISSERKISANTATKLTVLVASEIKRHNLKCCHFRKFFKKNNILHPAPQLRGKSFSLAMPISSFPHFWDLKRMRISISIILETNKL